MVKNDVKCIFNYYVAIGCWDNSMERVPTNLGNLHNIVNCIVLFCFQQFNAASNALAHRSLCNLVSRTGFSNKARSQ